MSVNANHVLDAQTYLECIEANQCKDSLTTQVSKLVCFHDNIRQLNTAEDTQYATLLERITSLSETLMANIQNGIGKNNETEEAASQEAYHETNEEHVWVTDEVGDFTFSDVIGAQDAIQVIKESIIIPVRYPVLFKMVKATAWKGALLYGPPGTGKSLLAKAAAGEAKASFFNSSCASLTSKWVGGSEKLVRSLFEAARLKSPSIIFLDEIDSIASSRDRETSTADQRLTNQLLVEIDKNANMKSMVLVLAATNLPWQLDSAVMRRLPKKIYVPLPSEFDRKLILKKKLDASLALADHEYDQIAKNTEKFSGSDLVNFANDLVLQPLRLFIKSRSFVVLSDTEQNCVLRVSAYYGVLDASDGSTNCTQELVQDVSFDDMISKYGESVMRLPDITPDILYRTLNSYRQNICHVDISQYVKFSQQW